MVEEKQSGKGENVAPEDVIEKSWHKEVKWVDIVVKIKPERLDEYLALHGDALSGVRDLLEKVNMRNFSIFLVQLEDGNYYEFSFHEYWEDAFETNMAELDAEPRNKEWLKMCEPMQISLEGETLWKQMKRMYYYGIYEL